MIAVPSAVGPLERPIPRPSPPPLRGDLAPARRYRIGRSVEHRPIDAVVVDSSPDAALRLFVLGGQHGDEPWGREAVARWIDHARRAIGDGTASRAVGLAAIVDTNPDGSFHGTRKNAGGVDLNRDHRALSTPETVAIHRFVRRYQPHLVVDVHNYPARRRQLLRRDWTIDTDVQFGVPTHPAIRTALGGSEWEDLTRSIAESLSEVGYSGAPYTLVRRSGRARPSTLETHDARNALALRYGIPTLLLEGRDPGRTRTPEATERTTRAQLASLQAATAWAIRHRELLERGPPLPTAGETVPFDARWVEDGSSAPVLVRHPSSGRSEWLTWPRFAGAVRIREEVALPRAYAVRSDLRPVIDLLERQELSGELVRSTRFALAEEVGNAPTDPPGSPGDRMVAGPVSSPIDLSGYVVYSTCQRGARALAVWLETGSRHGLLRGPLPEGTAGSDPRPALLRVRVWDYPPVSWGGNTLRTPGGMTFGCVGSLSRSEGVLAPPPAGSGPIELRSGTGGPAAAP